MICGQGVGTLEWEDQMGKKGEEIRKVIWEATTKTKCHSRGNMEM